MNFRMHFVHVYDVQLEQFEINLQKVLLKTNKTPEVK